MPDASAQAAAGRVNLYSVLKNTSTFGFDPLHEEPAIAGIEVGIFLKHLFEVNDHEHRFTAEYYVQYKWLDTRDFTPLFEAAKVHSPIAGCDAVPSIEFGGAEQALIWKPDLHVANIAGSHKTRFVKMRMFAMQDGAHVVQMDMLFNGQLEMENPSYFNYPFDQHELTIRIESAAFSEDRIRLQPSSTYMGVSVNTDTWPGWYYVSHSASSEARHPESVSNDACMEDFLSRAAVELSILVKRGVSGYQKNTFMPTHLLVMTSWAGFWLKHSALMPRIATAFISFLTLTGWSNSVLGQIPKVTYGVWLNTFMETGRLFMLLSLVETILAHVVVSMLSTRVAISLDFFCRWYVPLNYAVITIILYAQKLNASGVEASENILFAICASVLFGMAACVALSYARMRRSLRNDVIGVSMAAKQPLDQNEIDYLYDLWDTDHKQALTPKEIVHGALHASLAAQKAGQPPPKLRYPVLCELSDAKLDELTQAVAAKSGEHMTREQFRSGARAILIELAKLVVCAPAHAQRKEGATSAAPSVVEPIKSRAKVSPAVAYAPAAQPSLPQADGDDDDDDDDGDGEPKK